MAMMSDNAMKKTEEGDARVPYTAAVTITTKWQDAMTMTGRQQIGNDDRDCGISIPKNQHSNSSSTSTSSPNKLRLRRSVSFACDNADFHAENKDAKPPSTTATSPSIHNVAKEEKHRHDRGDDEGYEHFLGLLASSPAPARALAPSSPSASSMTLSVSEEHDPRRASFACGDVDTKVNNYCPPSAQPQALDQLTTDAGKDGEADDGQECKIVAVGIHSLPDLYDSPHLGEKKEEEEAGIPIIASFSIDDNGNGGTGKSCIRGVRRGYEPLPCPEISESEQGKQVPPITTSGYDNNVATSRLQDVESSLPLKSLISRSSSCSDISKMKMSMTLSLQGKDAQAAIAPRKDPEWLSNESKNAGDQIHPPSINQIESLRSKSRQPSSRKSHLSVSWHPAPEGKDPSDQPEHSEGTDTPAAVAPRKDPVRLSKESKNAGDQNILPSFNQMKSFRFRSEIRQPPRHKDLLSVSWHPAPEGKDPSAQPEHSERKEIKKKPDLMKQASSILRTQRPSMQVLRHRSALDPADMEQIQIIIDDDKVHPSRKNLHWWHAVFFFSIISLLVCLLQIVLPPPYGLMMTSTEVAAAGVAPGCEDDLERCICPSETICATDKLSIILLALARCSAFFDYPLYMMLFLSKAHNLNNHLRRTICREWIDFGDMHTVHKIFGIVVGIETMSHSFFHLLRWGLNNEMSMLWQTATGITGFIAAAVTPLICWPMVFPFLKRHLSFEVRKGLHYLSIVWAIALLFHAPSKILWLIGLPAAVYVVDHLFGYFMKNNLIETAYFERYGENGVALHFKNPKSWEDRSPTSYVYIMCPWISKYQWHAFTMFPDPSKENHSMLCIGASGDWTKQLFNKIQTPCLRQLYVHGPLMTEFSDKAITTSNAIAVATGVGITPTLSLMMNYVGRKRINIIWVCRDPGLIEYTLHNIDISAITRNSYAFIFYTGQRELALPKHLPVNIFIFKSRPNLEHTITGIITAIHSGEGLPEEMYENQKKIANTPFRKRMMIAMNRVTEIYDENEMFDYAVKEKEKAAERMQDIDLETGVPSDSGNDSEVHGGVKLTRPSVTAPPEDTVSLLGFDAMISRFLGVIGEYSDSDIEELFHTIDIDRTGFIDRGDFIDFIMMIKRMYAANQNQRSSRELLSSMVALTDMEAAFTNSMHNSTSLLTGVSSHHNVNTSHGALVFGDTDTIEYMRNLMNDSFRTGERALEDWSLFYCGGSTGIKKNLKDISKRYNIDLAVEKFDW